MRTFYRGERRDGGTGNYQLGSRTYDPSKAAFLSQDTYRNDQPGAHLALGTDPLTQNRYAYVNGDPVNYADPSGHRQEAYGSGCSSQSDCARMSQDNRQRGRSYTGQQEMTCTTCSNGNASLWAKPTPRPPAPEEDEGAWGFLKKAVKVVAPVVAAAVAYTACTAGSAGTGVVACGFVAGAAYGYVHGVINCDNADLGCIAQDTLINGVTGAAGGLAGKGLGLLAKATAPGLTATVTAAANRATGAVTAGLNRAAGTVTQAVATSKQRVANRIAASGHPERVSASVGGAAKSAPDLPDETVLVRGGLSDADGFAGGSGVTSDAEGLLSGVSVNSGRSLAEAAMGGGGLRNGQLGVSTVGEVRSAGGTVTRVPRPSNPGHCEISGCSAVDLQQLFQPTIPNAWRRRG